MENIFVLRSFIFFLLFGCGNVFSSDTHLPVVRKDLISAELSKTNLNPSDFELMHPMAHNPEFIYSAFMRDRLDSTKSVTAKCQADVWRVVLDVVLFKVYAIKSKYLSYIIMLCFLPTRVVSLLKNLKYCSLFCRIVNSLNFFF